MLTNKHAVIYARLSSEDGLDDVSLSIQNQIEICKNYASCNDFIIDEVYYDDGYSGTNFNRPEFQRLIKDIECNKVKAVITKDLSRLGRNFIKTSYYVEEVFQQYNVRYISVNENYDSFLSEDDISLPLINFINDMYAKDCKKKIRASYEKRKVKGSIAVDGIYGYIIEDGKLVVDESVRYVIEYIFNSYINNHKIKDIISYLKENKISTPSYHKQFELKSKFKYSLSKDQYAWDKWAIYRILKSEEYIGSAVNCKRSIKYVIPNNHEAIIEETMFKEVQEKIASKTYKTKITDKDRLKGMFFTEDGKSFIYKHVPHEKKDTGRRYVLTDLSFRFDADMAHQILYEDSLKVFNMIKYNEQELLNKIPNLNVKVDITLLENKKKDLEYRFKSLFEDYVLGEIDVIEYNSKVATLNTEIQSIEQAIQQSIISKTLIENKRNKFRKFIHEVKNMKADIDKLDFIRIFIAKVIVSNDGNLKFNIIYKYEV